MTRETVEYCYGGGCLKESKHFLVSQDLPSLCPLLLHVPLHTLLSNKRSGRLYRWPCSSQLSQWELLAWEVSWPYVHPPSSRASTGGPKVYWRLDWMPRCRGQTNLATELPPWLLGTSDDLDNAKYHTYATPHCATKPNMRTTLHQHPCSAQW